jgi:hypothetical protein
MRRLYFGASICIMGIAVVVSCRAPARVLPAGLCWRSLGPDTGIQDVGLATTELALGSRGPDEAWLSWQENSPRVLRWAKWRWWPVPMPARPDAEAMRFPVVVAVNSVDATLAVSANGKDGTSALHIARWSGASWEWLGTPLISSQVPFTHAHGRGVEGRTKGTI